MVDVPEEERADQKTTEIPAAVNEAREADQVILAVGGQLAWFSNRTEGEGSDTTNIDLPAQRVEIINAATTVLAAYREPHQGTAITDSIRGEDRAFLSVATVNSSG
jgi:hypothetical protein